jgi:hypothetical protein
LRGQAAVVRGIDGLDVRIRQSVFLVEPLDDIVDLRVVPAFDQRDGRSRSVDPLLPQLADVVVDDVLRSRAKFGELCVAPGHVVQDGGECPDVILVGLRWREVVPTGLAARYAGHTARRYERGRD